MTLGVSLIPKIYRISSISCRSESSSVLRWAKYLNLYNCLDDVMWCIRYLGYMVTSLQKNPGSKQKFKIFYSDWYIPIFLLNKKN